MDILELLDFSDFILLHIIYLAQASVTSVWLFYTCGSLVKEKKSKSKCKI